MTHCETCSKEIKKLLNFLEQLKSHSLGLDWESKREIKQIQDKVVDKIKNFRCSEVVK